MSILPSENLTSFTPVTSITQQMIAESKSTISRSMQADLNLNAHLMAESRDKLAVELARTQNLSPQEMMNKITKIQKVTQQIENLATSYNDASDGELTKSDMNSMRDMSKRYGQKITAKCFGTNQPNVSDLLSGKVKID